MIKINNKLLFAMLAYIGTISAPEDVSANAATVAQSREALNAIRDMHTERIELETRLNALRSEINLSHQNFENQHCNHKIIAIAEEHLPGVREWFDSITVPFSMYAGYTFDLCYNREHPTYSFGSGCSIIGRVNSPSINSTLIERATNSINQTDAQTTYYIINCHATTISTEEPISCWSLSGGNIFGWKMPDSTQKYKIYSTKLLGAQSPGAAVDIIDKFLVQDANRYLQCPDTYNRHLLPFAAPTSNELTQLLDAKQYLKIFKIIDEQTEA